MMAAAWDEIELVKKENRHELVLTGEDISQRIDEDGLDESLYKLDAVNFLEISRTTLKVLGHAIGDMKSLTTLILQNNVLTALPETIGNVSKLKMLDISNNKITSLPQSLSQLENLHTFKANCNEITSFIDITDMIQLHNLDISHNKLTSFPEGCDSDTLTLMASIKLQNNEIKEVPDLSVLPVLKYLDISNNLIEDLPASLSMCTKLKDFIGKDNKIKDRSFAKTVQQGKTKPILDALAKKMKRELGAKGSYLFEY